MSLQIIQKVVSSFSQNARLLYCDETNDGVLLDPGAEAKTLLELAKSKNVQIRAVWLTHAHPDHCGAVAEIKRLINVPLYAHPEGKALRSNVVSFMAMCGLSTTGIENCPEPDVVLEDKAILNCGNIEFQVLYTSGHSPDHICYYSKSAGIVFTGDLLFAGSVGRTDLPGGSSEELHRSLRDVVFKLPPQTEVYSGHGAKSVLKVEMETNPFI